MRSAIALLLLSLAVGGCDRQSTPTGQASPTAEGAPATPSAPAAAATEAVVQEVIGTLDRTHKGTPAPAIWFQDPAGTMVNLGNFRGKPVLLNLWATWCVPCVKEMPTLDAVAQSMGDRLHVIAVSEDLEGPSTVNPWFRKAGFKALQPYFDPPNHLVNAFTVNLPTTILYDSQGNEVWRMLGGMDWTGQTASELIAEAR